MANEDVWNKAAIYLGASGDRTTDYTSPQTALQDNFSEMYLDAIDLTLALYDWSFARKRARPAEVTATYAPPEEWNHTWSYPTDCVKIRGFSIQGRVPGRVEKIPYEVGRSLDDSVAQVIYTRMDPFVDTHYLIYTKRITPAEESQWSREFERALAAMLAREVGMSTARDLNFQQSMLNMARAYALESTEIDDHNEQPRQTRPALVEVRNT